MEAYQKLEKRFERMYRLHHLMALAGWDQHTAMPEKGAEARGEAMATLEEILHQMMTAPETKELLDAATAGKEALSPVQQANLREMARKYRTVSALPEEFVSRQIKLITRADGIWRKARANNDFATFLPVLRELVALAREQGAYLAKGTNMTPYEALMDLYEPGLTVERLDEIYGQVKSWLPDLLQKIVKQQQETNKDMIPLQGPFDVKKQEELCREIMRVWQFDFDAGALAVSAHAFTGNVKEDTRITTNYSTDALAQGIYGVIHETGHAKYEMNMGPRDMITQPVCEARSLGIHESQSLLCEFQVGHNEAFLEFLAPKLVEYFGEQPGFAPDNLKKVFNTVKPGYIRIDADEVCYPLHVILRYEMERDLMSGKLEAEDVPTVWNEKMKQYLGIETLGRDDVGCLQDIHWAGGMLGYFPTYSLGAMNAAQIMASIRKELGPDTVDDCLRSGELTPIFAKQKEKIWNHGSTLLTDELMIQATGEKLNPDYLRQHLEARYLKA